MKLWMLLMLLLLIPTALAYNLEILETNPSPVQAGQYADITVQLISTASPGEVREEVVLSIDGNEDIRPAGGQIYTLNQISGGDRRTRTFRVFFSADLPAGNVPITFNIQDGGITIKSEEDVFIKGSTKSVELLIGDIKTTPKELLKDTKNNQMVITLQNLGGQKAQLLSAEIVPPPCCFEESFTYSLRDSISSLEGGEEAELEYTFDILDTADDIIKAKLVVRYRTFDELTNSYVARSETIPFDVPVTKAPDIVITKIESLSLIETRSQENQLLIQVTNAGEEVGESIRIRLYPDPSHPFDFERTNYFITSRLKPGGNASVIVKFDVLDFATVSTYPIAVEFESIVGESRYIQDDDVEIIVSGIGTNQAVVFRNAFLTGAGAIAVLLGVFVILGRLKRRRSSK